MKSGKAVLYTIDLCKALLECDGPTALLPLGLEPLPRPEAQKAIAIQFLPGDMLNNKSWVRSRIFDITERDAIKYFEMFEEGLALFPSNPFDDHIQWLRDNRAIPKPILEASIGLGWLPPHKAGIGAAAHELQSAGYDVTNDSVTTPRESIRAAENDWQQRMPAFRSRIRLRGVCDHLQLD